MADGEADPSRPAKIRLVICTQVLEYVPEPRAVIAEIRRVLKPGGTLVLSVPADFPWTSVQDSGRFLPESLRVLLHSFYGVEIEAEGSVSRFFSNGLCIPDYICPALVSR